MGAQKAGTTALDAYLRLCPDVALPHRSKELHFFDNNDLMAKSVWLREAFYHYNFRNAKGNIWGEITPRYMTQEEYIRRIYDYNNEAKIIVCLREPVERAYSQWNMERQRGRETRGFADAIEENFLELKVAQEKAYIERSLYAKQIEVILKYFERSSIYFINQEALRREPQRVLDSLLYFYPLIEFQFFQKFVSTKELTKNHLMKKYEMSLSIFFMRMWLSLRK